MAPRIVQWVGDLYDAAAAYIGAVREIRIDISNWDIILHDGTTPGGHRIMNMTNADLRYQKLNSELGGLGPFPPGSRGILVRATDTEYILRVMQETPDGEVIIQNPDGFGGNFVLSLADTFPRHKTFNNGVTIVNGLAVDTINATWIATTGGYNGNADFRGKTVYFDPGQIPLTAIAGLDAHIMTLGCPLGVIMLWNHNYGGIPAGWHICDGTAGTVDLRDRFVVGAGGNYAAAQVGGVSIQNAGNVVATAITIAQMPSHTHTVNEPAHHHNITDPSHVHYMPEGLVTQTGSGVALGGAGGQFAAVVNNSTNNVATGITINDANIGISVNPNGGDQGHTHGTNNFDNRPPFYAEYYIQHIGP